MDLSHLPGFQPRESSKVISLGDADIHQQHGFVWDNINTAKYLNKPL